MLPFEGAQWRFEQPLSFVQYYLPFHLLVDVCDTLFDLDLTQADMRMSADVLNTRLQRCLNGIKDTVAWIEPTNLLLDSWALILSETLLRRLSSHSEHQARMSYGRITGRRIADVVDYIEVGIDQDLRLQALADVAVMSVHHFAHSFKETVGISPHAYVLERRISRARAMLGRGSDQLAYIALACGFSSQAHLTTAFRYRLGVTPANYRRSL